MRFTINRCVALLRRVEKQNALPNARQSSLNIWIPRIRSERQVDSPQTIGFDIVLLTQASSGG